MTQHAATRFFSSLFCDFARDNFANSTEPKLAAFDVAFHLLTVFRSRAFGNYNDSAKITGRFASVDHGGDFAVIERNFRN